MASDNRLVEHTDPTHLDPGPPVEAGSSSDGSLGIRLGLGSAALAIVWTRLSGLLEASGSVEVPLPR